MGAFLGEVFRAEQPTLRGEHDFEPILAEALTRWGVLFIDDRQENVAAARDAGIRAALFQPSAGTETARELRCLLDAAGYGNIAGARS